MATSLTTGRPWRVILLFTLPLMIGNVVQQLYHFADTIVVGRLLGVDALAAVGATGSLLFLLLGFAWGLKSGFAIPTAQAYGAFNEKAGMALRATFLVDAEGKVAFAEVNQPGDAREQSGWKDAVAQLA